MLNVNIRHRNRDDKTNTEAYTNILLDYDKDLIDWFKNEKVIYIGDLWNKAIQYNSKQYELLELYDFENDIIGSSPKDVQTDIIDKVTNEKYYSGNNSLKLKMNLKINEVKLENKEYISVMPNGNYKISLFYKFDKNSFNELNNNIKLYINYYSKSNPQAIISSKQLFMKNNNYNWNKIEEEFKVPENVNNIKMVIDLSPLQYNSIIYIDYIKIEKIFHIPNISKAAIDCLNTVMIVPRGIQGLSATDLRYIFFY